MFEISIFLLNIIGLVLTLLMYLFTDYFFPDFSKKQSMTDHFTQLLKEVENFENVKSTKDENPCHTVDYFNIKELDMTIERMEEQFTNLKKDCN